MSNSLSASNPEYWSRRMQRKHHKSDIFRAIANFAEEAVLKKGDKVHRPYRSELTDDAYVRGSDVSIQDLTDTDESMDIDQERAIGFYVDDFDALQHNYKVVNEYSDDAAVKLGNRIDMTILNTARAGASNAHAVGTLSTSNVLQMFATAGQKLDEQNVPLDQRFAGISPQVKAILNQYLASKGTALGDKVSLNGKIGRFYDFDLHLSNNLAWTGELALATQVTADDTVTVNGVVFTFKASPASAGEVDIGADADGSRANLTAAINGGSGAGSTYIEVSTADRLLLKDITATNNDTTNVMSLVGVGKSYVVVSETLTDGTDTFTAASQLQHNVFGKKGSIDCVVQSKPMVQFNQEPKRKGKNVLATTLFGTKVFADGGRELVDVTIRTDSFS